MFLDIDRDEAEKLEQIGACFILEGNKNDNTADTKSKTNHGPGGVSCKLKSAKAKLKGRFNGRRRADNSDSKSRNRKDRKTNIKETD